MYTLGTLPTVQDEEVDRIKLSGLPRIVKWKGMNICKYFELSSVSSLFKV